MFARTLVELGKDYELKFYLSALEKLYTETKSCDIGFQLGVVYSIGSFSNLLVSKKLFESVLLASKDPILTTKSKMFLADIYDSQNDVAACRKLVDSMDNTSDHRLNGLVSIWKAKVYKDEGDFEKSFRIIQLVLQEYPSEKDWYCFFSAKLILASLKLKERKKEESLEIIQSLKTQFSGKGYKSVHDQIRSFEKKLATYDSQGLLTVDESEDVLIVSHLNKHVEIEKRSALGKLVRAFLKKEALNKQIIIRVIYDRQYVGIEDNKLIYYHIHSLRKELKKLGLPNEIIAKSADGYSLLPEITSIKKEAHS